MSIKIVTAIYSAVVIIVLTLVIVIVGYNLYENHVMENYKKYTTTVLEYAYTVASDYSFGDIIAKRAKQIQETGHLQLPENEYKNKKELGRALEELEKGLIKINN